VSIDTVGRIDSELSLLTPKTAIHPTTKDRGLSRLNPVKTGELGLFKEIGDRKEIVNDLTVLS
jgi:hypothetical protein